MDYNFRIVIFLKKRCGTDMVYMAVSKNQLGNAGEFETQHFNVADNLSGAFARAGINQYQVTSEINQVGSSIFGICSIYSAHQVHAADYFFTSVFHNLHPSQMLSNLFIISPSFSAAEKSLSHFRI
ncbi:MAG: hypothetical protein A4E71_01080 [Smithella sp. PtaU1.Bin162]|nr:MAG: hypothetical protein A4E71_01080 [Smithella sp. PtaU1.Bin162]